jgi:hypothetical protein
MKIDKKGATGIAKRFFAVFSILLCLALSAAKGGEFDRYRLEGEYERENLYGDFWEKRYFEIYNKMIYKYIESEAIFVDKFPDGEFELTTKNNSKIKISVADGALNDLIVHNREDFLKNEKETSEDNYCVKGMFYGLMYYLYGKEQYRNVAKDIKIKNLRGEIEELSDEGFYVYREGNNYIALENYGEDVIIGPIFGQVDFVFDKYGRNLVDVSLDPEKEHCRPTAISVKDCLLIYHDS